MDLFIVLNSFLLPLVFFNCLSISLILRLLHSSVFRKLLSQFNLSLVLTQLVLVLVKVIQLFILEDALMELKGVANVFQFLLLGAYLLRCQ